MGRLSGKVAFVTGAASGIGAACALRFAEEGAAIAGMDLNKSEGERLGRRREERARLALRDRRRARGGAHPEIVAAVKERLGRIDVLVNSAGVAGGGIVHMLEQKDWDFVRRREPEGHLPRLEARRAGDARAGEREHREHRERRGHRGLPRRQLLQRLEGRRGAAHQEHGDRLRARGRARERDLPGLHRHADVPLRVLAGGDEGDRRRRSARRTSSGASASPSRSRTRRSSSPRTRPAS